MNETGVNPRIYEIWGRRCTMMQAEPKGAGAGGARGLWVVLLQIGDRVKRNWAYTWGVVVLGVMAGTGAMAQTRYGRISDAPEYLKYLSPRCSAMSDAIRTGPARGVRYDTTAELQRNYYVQCAEDDSEARNKMAAEHRDAQKVKRESVQAEQASVQRSQLAQQQCDESKRILYAKKRRTDLSDGEKSDLLRFEENYKNRCG